VVLALGLLLVVVGAALLINLGGAADAVIRRVTSRNLGELAPGYAARPGGFRVYSTLVLALGIAVAGLGISSGAAVAGAVAMVLGIAVFVIASVLAIAGEVRTYRALADRRQR
jgi:hypothetical protein